MKRVTIIVAASVLAFSFGCKKKKGGGSSDFSQCPCYSHFAELGYAAVDFAADDKAVYSCQTYSGVSDIMKTSLDGRTSTTLAHMPMGCYSVATDGTSVYWVTIQGSVVKVPVDGGSVTTLSAHGDIARSLVVKDNNLYWSHTADADGRIMTMPIAGGAVTTLATAQKNPAHLAVDGTNVYWITDRFGPNDVVKVPRAGGTPTTIATENIPVTGVVSDGSVVYWLTGSRDKPGSVVSVNVAGGTVSSIGDTGGPTAPQLSEDGILWGDESAQGVIRFPMHGGSPSTIFADIDSTNRFVTDGAENYYWSVIISSDSYTNTEFFKLNL